MTGTKVQIPKEVYEKVIYWVKKADFEVSGFGTILYDEVEKAFVVQDAFLIKQEGSGASTDIDAKSLSQAMYIAHKNKLKGTLNWWWHSHVNMAVFWSSTDEDTIKQLGTNGWIVASVFNKSEEVRSAFCARTTVPYLGVQNHYEDDIETEISNYYPDELTKSWDKEFTDNVERKTYKQVEMPQYKGARPYQGSLLTHDVHNMDADLEQEYRQDAKLLGMTYEKYMNILNTADWRTVADLEDQLVELYNKNKESRA